MTSSSHSAGDGGMSRAAVFPFTGVAYNGKNEVYGPCDRDIGKNAAKVQLGSLGLKIGDGFGYRFNFRVDWQHCAMR